MPFPSTWLCLGAAFNCASAPTYSGSLTGSGATGSGTLFNVTSPNSVHGPCTFLWLIPGGMGAGITVTNTGGKNWTIEAHPTIGGSKYSLNFTYDSTPGWSGTAWDLPNTGDPLYTGILHLAFA